ncbi:MAG TPA: isoprenylcysteine carboxylmethyltransferase family protein, partial [Bryobacteraceae bacterium]|nr:isoprenylcysteine carboxylmethyltransferase family protein [Bryobacteraceae bacterium]
MTEVSQNDWKSSHSAWSLVARRLRVPLGFAFGVLYVWLARPTRNSLVAGGLMLLPGLFLRGLASGHVQKDKQLTTSGPYAYTRNPLYLGSLILAAGFAVAARNWWIVVVMAAIFAAIYIPVIAGEENFLRRTFPTYEDYARHVPRMLPRLTPYGGEQSAYSSARYWKHREYQAILGCTVVLCILVLK